MTTPLRFRELLFDSGLFAREGESSPLSGFGSWANTHVKNERTGAFKTNINRPFFLEKLDLDLTLVRGNTNKLVYFLNFYHGSFGSGFGFRCRSPWDYVAQDEVIGTIAAGETKSFTLVKTYLTPGATDFECVRYITKPVATSHLATGGVTLYEPDGVTPRVVSVPFVPKVGGSTSGFTYTIDNTTGELRVVSTTASGVATWTGEHDFPAAFVGNELSHKSVSDTVSRVSQVQIREVPYYELAITIH
jgi:uncharacterized protein (TIGR02217 family)